MATINLSMFSDMTQNLASEPYDTNVTAEQPWINTKFSLYDSDIEIRSADGFIFQLHRVVLGVTTGTFPGSEMDTGGEMVQLTEPANVLSILFSFLYPKAPPDLRGESFKVVAAVAEAVGKYEVFLAVEVCNQRLADFLPQHAPEILAHAVKHDYPRLISATLPHFARAPFNSVLEKLPLPYVVPWARYREVWTSLFKETDRYVRNLGHNGSSSCSHGSRDPICNTCVASLYVLIEHLEGIDKLSTLRNTLRSPDINSLPPALNCCKNSSYSSRSICPFVANVTKLCEDKIEKIPSFATFLGLKV